MAGRPVIRIPTLRCQRCLHTWQPRQVQVRMCPRCKSLLWDVPPKTARKRRAFTHTRERPQFVLEGKAFDYLFAEHRQLLREFWALASDWHTLSPEERRVYHAKVREHRLLVANHRLARRLARQSPVHDAVATAAAPTDLESATGRHDD